MGSTSPPQTPGSPTAKATTPPQPPPLPPPLPPPISNAIEESISVSELKLLLAKREKEIRALKFELEKYKLALHQSQLDYHYVQQQLLNYNNFSNKDKTDSNTIDTLDTATTRAMPSTRQEKQSFAELNTLIGNTIHEEETSGQLSDLDSDGLLVVEPASTHNSGGQIKITGRHSSASAPSTSSIQAGSITNRVLFRTGDDDDDDNDEEDDNNINNNSNSNDNDDVDDISHLRLGQELSSDDLDEIIQDVGEIDLNLELEAVDSKNKFRKRCASATGKVSRAELDEAKVDEVDEDIISEGLLTSLTDAAINNLSQLAALQERCESQQHSHQYRQQSHHHQQQQQQERQQARLISSSHNASPGLHKSNTLTSPTSLGAIGMNQASAGKFTHDPFTSSSIADQAAIAINAAAGIQPITHSQQPVSSSSSISPNSTIQADLSSTNSLASVVAAAAVAAAAANDQQQQHDHHAQTRLISSALPSPDFYHSLHHHHHHHHHSHQSQQNIQHQNSPVSLHFSPSTSVTPSPSSLMAHSRRSASNTSSSLMSPIVSPNYLRRQFMPDRLPLMSPSPTSGLTTCSSSGASSSLAHILHNQQRSASALGGPITSSSSTPLSCSGGSTAVSPLMSNKNSSQARLNNMQIRHKFGYLGSGRAQFNSPHGFCLGLNQEIVVADTNNHRVCIFDKSGAYITQFGSPGKEEGQLWNPRKVAILHRPVVGSSQQGSNSNSTINQLQTSHQNQASSPYSINNNNNNNNIQNNQGQLSSGSEPLYVVCDRGAERSRMQLFTKDGAFIKKIGIHYIDIVAGLAITQNGLIIVVDSVSPTVYIINGETGILNGWFDCSGYMKEPSDIAVKSDVPGNEYFICDFKGHCVVVFSEQGEYLRKIGHDGLTSYPNGIDISDDGDILVGDSHGNRFHVVVFDRNGNFVSQFECPHVKVSRCCGLKITREGYIVTLAKNNHHVLVLDTIHI